MKLIFAQGNPGREYARTRHNVGFITLDMFADSVSASWKTETKFKADIASATIHGEKVLLVKPLTYYNETGQTARSLVDFYKLDPASDVLVIHDELALPFGTIRVRQKGSDAGNNGIKSLNAHLGKDYTRIRVGVWSEDRNTMDDAAFVLSAFTSEQQEKIASTVSKAIHELIVSFVDGTLESSSQTT
jgi:PTH1 family peptidyl-tRNA hydrolase